jgi:hypothetical protein
LLKVALNTITVTITNLFLLGKTKPTENLYEDPVPYQVPLLLIMR